jgi:hypothetical protein
MLILLITLVLLVASMLIWRYADEIGSVTLEALSTLLCSILAAFLVVIPLSRLQDRLFMEEVKTFELTINDNRENKSEIERAAILTQITKINRRLAKAKYLNTTFIGDVLVVDALCELDYVQ